MNVNPNVLTLLLETKNSILFLKIFINVWVLFLHLQRININFIVFMGVGGIFRVLTIIKRTIGRDTRIP